MYGHNLTAKAHKHKNGLTPKLLSENVLEASKGAFTQHSVWTLQNFGTQAISFEYGLLDLHG